MKTLLKKIHQAKKMIKETKLQKLGFNDYSKYHYFLPEQIEKLVFDVCDKLQMVTKFDLIRNELGTSGKLSIFDIETGESIAYEMATEIPEIKATNVAQQLGGCMTYTERYLKMTAFGISENTLDPDTPAKPENKKQKQPNTTEPEKWLNIATKDGEETKEWANLKKAVAEKKLTSVADVRKHYKVSKTVAEEIETLLKSK